ncbi:MAG TPA: hypothetical protein VIS48_01025 [Candidatus Kryptonia bacterium]
MFEKEISGYAFNVAKRYTGDRIPLGVILTDVELPDNFKKFADAEVEEMIDREELGESRTGRFDLSEPQIRALFKEIRHVLKNSFEFSREEFLEVAGKASKFIYNYVIRPKWTLEKFIFKGEPEVGRREIENAARYLSDYPFYLKGIFEYLDFHDTDKLDLESWKKVHAKIDEHILATISTRLENITAALYDLFKFSTDAARVPTDALILFFRDKSDSDMVDRIEFAKEVKNIAALDTNALRSVFEATTKDVNQNIAVLKSPESPPKEFRPFEMKPVPGPMQPKPVETPRFQSPGRETPPDIQQIMAEHAKSVASAPPPKPETPARRPAVRSLISAKAELRIVKKLFKGSRSAYQVALHRLDECSDWQSASRIVEGIFIDNGIDPFSKYAVAFTDAVSSKFRGDVSTGSGS